MTKANTTPTSTPANSNTSRVARAWADAKSIGVQAIGTPYHKTLIEGHRNIYWASPVYGHSDYNKAVAFPNTPDNRRVMHAINGFLLYSEKGLNALNTYAAKCGAEVRIKDFGVATASMCTISAKAAPTEELRNLYSKPPKAKSGYLVRPALFKILKNPTP